MARQDYDELQRNYKHAKRVLNHHSNVRRSMEKELTKARKSALRSQALVQGQSALLTNTTRQLRVAEKKVADRDALLMSLRGWLLHQGNYRIEDMAMLDKLALSLGDKHDLTNPS